MTMSAVAALSGAGSPEGDAEPGDESRRAVDRGRRSEEVKVGTLERDADTAVREPSRVAAVQVVDRPAGSDVRDQGAGQ